MKMIVVLFLSVNAFAKGLSVEHAYIRPMPTGATTSSMYFELSNKGSKKLYIIGVSGEVGTTEIHTHIKENGVYQMREVSKIEVPAKAKVEFKPGGYHIMLMGLKRSLKLGDKVKIKLILKDKSTFEIEAIVKEYTDD